MNLDLVLTLNKKLVVFKMEEIILDEVEIEEIGFGPDPEQEACCF